MRRGALQGPQPWLGADFVRIPEGERMARRVQVGFPGGFPWPGDYGHNEFGVTK
jgi:hypothetical protein